MGDGGTVSSAKMVRLSFLTKWDVTQLEQEAGKYLSTMSQAASEQLSLDGKTLRGTIPPGEPQGVHVLAVQEVTKNLVLAQTAVGMKENEISAARSCTYAICSCRPCRGPTSHDGIIHCTWEASAMMRQRS